MVRAGNEETYELIAFEQTLLVGHRFAEMHTKLESSKNLITRIF